MLARVLILPFAFDDEKNKFIYSFRSDRPHLKNEHFKCIRIMQTKRDTFRLIRVFSVEVKIMSTRFFIFFFFVVFFIQSQISNIDARENANNRTPNQQEKKMKRKIIPTKHKNIDKVVGRHCR